MLLRKAFARIDDRTRRTRLTTNRQWLSRAGHREADAALYRAVTLLQELDVRARSWLALAGTDDPTAQKEDLTPAALTAESAATGSRGDAFIRHDR